MASATLQFGSNTEFVVSETTPKVGDVLTRNGDTWEVVEVEEHDDGTSTVILIPR